MLKPRAFNPSRKYPVIVYVYGEPAAQTVTDRWGGSGALFHRVLADAGYIVVSFDNRGTPAPKGAAWRKVIYGSVGDLSSKEQAAAIRALAARAPYIDLARVGIWGWSGGGSNTLNAMFRFPDVYAVGVAVAPVPDQRLYDTIYQERYMGLPEEQRRTAIRIGSPINFADGLKGKLLIVHGSGDDNVHYQGTERLINRLVELGKPFDRDGLSESHPRDRRGTGHDAARVSPHRTILPGTSPSRGDVNQPALAEEDAAPDGVGQNDDRRDLQREHQPAVHLDDRQDREDDEEQRHEEARDARPAFSQGGAADAGERDREHHQIGQRVEDRRRVPQQLKRLLLADADQPDDAERRASRRRRRGSSSPASGSAGAAA